MKRDGSRSVRAFTLVELLVVIGILGIILAVGIPNLHRRLSPNSIEQAVKDMLEACSHARAYAILQSTAVDLVLDAETGGISLQPVGGAMTSPASDPDAPPPIETEFEEPQARPTSPLSTETLNFSAKLSEAVAIELLEVSFEDQLQYTAARVRFYPNGTCDEMKMLLWHQESGERRLITTEVSTALADVESDLSKMHVR
jgi:prepilin-type N-terminal cleavage/methylation domain-containing protein